MKNCCDNINSICEKFNCQIKETDKGIQVDVSPKDESKIKSFQALIKSCKEFCGCDC